MKASPEAGGDLNEAPLAYAYLEPADRALPAPSGGGDRSRWWQTVVFAAGDLN